MAVTMFFPPTPIQIGDLLFTHSDAPLASWTTIPACGVGTHYGVATESGFAWPTDRPKLVVVVRKGRETVCPAGDGSAMIRGIP